MSGEPRATRTDDDQADTDAITDAMLRASRLLVAISIRSIAAVDGSITLPQFRLLAVLDVDGPTNLAALAERLGVNPSVTTRMIDRLTGSGLVDRRVNPANRRVVVLSLTDSGERVVGRVMAERRRSIAGIVGRLSARHRDGLVSALAAFSDAGGEPVAGTNPHDARHVDWS